MREKKPFEELEGVHEAGGGRRRPTSKPDGGRVLLRYSGTEPKVRLLLEGRDAEVLEKHAKIICEAIRKQVGEGS